MASTRSERIAALNRQERSRRDQEGVDLMNKAGFMGQDRKQWAEQYPVLAAVAQQMPGVHFNYGDVPQLESAGPGATGSNLDSRQWSGHQPHPYDSDTQATLDDTPIGRTALGYWRSVQGKDPNAQVPPVRLTDYSHFDNQPQKAPPVPPPEPEMDITAEPRAPQTHEEWSRLVHGMMGRGYK